MQSRNYVESSIVEIGEPGEHWNPSRHTVPLPTDAYGCIDFRGGSQTNKAQVRSTECRVLSWHHSSSNFSRFSSGGEHVGRLSLPVVGRVTFLMGEKVRATLSNSLGM